MARNINEGSIVRYSSTGEEYEVLQIDGSRILVSPKDSEVDHRGDLPGFWGWVADFEVQLCYQHGSGHGTYNQWYAIEVGDD